MHALLLFYHFDSIKKSILVPIHPSGLPFIIIFCLITLIIGWIWSPLFFIGLILTLWCIYFFRNPDRITPENIDNNLVIAPADGKIIEIEEITPDEEIGLPKNKYTKIGIFMNVFNVHVNRSPIQGSVEHIVYKEGKFLNASLDKASNKNERSSLVLNTQDGTKIIVVQIAGLIARRIVCEVEQGQDLKQGDRIGMIRFGSRVDIYFKNKKVLAKLGQNVVAGESLIASE